MERYAKLAASALNQVLPIPTQIEDLEIPPDPKLGDFAFPCFKLSKSLKKAPAQIAASLVETIINKKALPPELTVYATGPYVNFLAPAQEVTKTVLQDLLAGEGLGHYGKLPEKSKGRWVLEYSSPNVAKPLNIYHLRPTALGAALDRIGRFRGFEVISINHLGDWGKQYGMLSVAFRRFNLSVEADLSMMDLVKLYVKINAEAEKDPSIEEEAREAFLKLEQGDAAISALWKKCVEISIREFERIYQRLNVHFDHIWGESFYKDQLRPLLNDLKKRSILIESEGAWVVPVTSREGKELPPCILQKKDGATIYATRDLAAALYRHQHFQFDRMTYIVGAEQKMHFEQVFGVLRRMNLDWEKLCEHVPFGLYRFKDAKMSTRKGNFITLEEVLTLAKERVHELMTLRAQTSESISTATKPSDEICEAIAIGAIVFHDLSTDPIRDVEFDIERVVDFEGETGPYLQYAHTRCLSILRKAAQNALYKKVQYESFATQHLQKDEEIRLIKTLGQFPLHLERSLTFAKANQLANYLIEVTKVFGVFYRECHVLGENPQLSASRLMLVEATRRILARGMQLMGIPLPERM